MQDKLTKDEAIKALDTLLTQVGNGYHVTYDDITRATQAVALVARALEFAVKEYTR